MSKDNTKYYHNHINKSIDLVQQRCNGYIKHRKSFLKEYYSPIQQKIKQLQKQIKYYEDLIENQNQMIQNQQQVSQLKTQIRQFKQTQSYFLSKLQFYQHQILSINIQNNVIQSQIHNIKHNLSSITQSKIQLIYQQLNDQDHLSHNTHNPTNINYYNKNDNSSHHKSIKTNLNHSQISSNTQSNHTHLNPILPTIFKVQKYYVNKQTSKIKHQQQNSNKIKTNKTYQNNQSLTVDVTSNYQSNQSLNTNQYKIIPNNTQIQLDVSNNHKIASNNLDQTLQNNRNQQTPQTINYSKTQISKKQSQIKQRFKQAISKYNKFELLFKECFDKKKSQVQKSVSQLQSKLISDRQKFLQICQAIGDKDLKRISFDKFQTITGDQIMTLLISFPWIQKKLFKQLNSKRKLIIQLQSNKFI